MRERIRPLLESLASFLAPGLVLLLLGIQVAFGLVGFEHPAENLLVILQVPGVLLGWGGVVLLLPLLVWMVLDWWGYNLGGFALKGLGSAVLGIAAGGIFGLLGSHGLLGGPAAGGLVGGGLADVLLETLGTPLAVAVLILMATPAAVLALSLQKGAPRPARAPKAKPKSKPKAKARADAKAKATPVRTEKEPTRGVLAHILDRFRGKRVTVQNRWYPKQRFDAIGNEIPMNFDRARDVGGIRYAGDDETEDAAAASESKATEATHPGGAEAPITEAPITEAKPSASKARAVDATSAEEAPTEEAPTEQTVRSKTIADLLEGEERLPTIPELLAGNFGESKPSFVNDPSGGPRERAQDGADDGPVHVDGEGLPHDQLARRGLPQRELPARPVLPVRPAPTPREPALPTAQAGTPEAATPEEGSEATAVPAEVRDPAPAFVAAAAIPTRPPTQELLPGVRYADEVPEPEPTLTDEDAEQASAAQAQLKAASLGLSTGVEGAVRGPASAPRENSTGPKALRDSVRASVEAMKADRESPRGGKNRYLEKLEALGMFDFGDSEVAQVPAPEASATDEVQADEVRAADAAVAEAPTRTPTPRKQRPTAKKPAAKQRADKRTAKKKAATKKPVAQKKVAKKPVAQKKVAKKPVAQKKVAKKRAAKSKAPNKPDARKPRATKPATPPKKAMPPKKAVAPKKATPPKARGSQTGGSQAAGTATKTKPATKPATKRGASTKASPKKGSPTKATTKTAPPKKRAPGKSPKTQPKTTHAKKTTPKKSPGNTSSAKGTPPPHAEDRQPPQAAAKSVALEARKRRAMLQGLRIERLDPLFSRAVEASLERGAATAVLLTRRLGLPFARATALVDRMVATGVLDPVSARGANAVRITRAEWESLTE